MELRRLRLLLELSRRGTLAAVADTLAYSPSSISVQLAELEREVGVKLLRRVGRNVQLTPAGWRLAAYAEQALAADEAILTELAGLGGTPRGQVRVTDEIGRLREVTTVVGAKQHGVSGEIEIGDVFWTDAVDSPAVDADAGDAGHAFQRKPGQVIPVGEAVEWHVDVRSSVRADGDHADRERDAGAVHSFSSFAVEVVEDVRTRKPRIGQQSFGDRVAEIYVTGHRHSLA